MFKCLFATSKNVPHTNVLKTCREAGVHLTFVESGINVINFIEKKSFHFMIIHESIEDLSIIEVIMLIRSLPNKKGKQKIPILVLSNSKQLAQEIVEKGANALAHEDDDFTQALRKIGPFLELSIDFRNSTLKNIPGYKPGHPLYSE